MVRLKGGDPYLFGRGGEEALALQRAGLAYEVVPGVSSALATPGQAGIPVTQRGVSRALHIITAHSAGDAAPDYRRYAALEGTLVFLMGLQRLPRIAADLIAGGLPASTPAAVVSGGNAPCPAAVRAPLADIAEAARKAGVQPPAVILVGEVAALDLRPAPPCPTPAVTGGPIPKTRPCRSCRGRVFCTVRSCRGKSGQAHSPNTFV